MADNGEAAGLYGVRVPVARRAAVTISIVVAGAAGHDDQPFTVLTPDVGSTYLISAFAVVIVGGIGNALGAVLAGIGIGIVTSLSVGLPGVLLDLAGAADRHPGRAAPAPELSEAV